MAQNYATKLAEGFAQRVMQIFYQTSVSDVITNSDYEGEVKDKLSKLNILTFQKLTLQNYTGSALTAVNPQESVGTLLTDQQKAWYFKIQSLSRFQSWIKNPENTLLDQLGKELKRVIDSYVLGGNSTTGTGGYYSVAAGQRDGTDYTTGTVAVDVAGNVTGTGTTFTAAMVGRPFKAAGMTAWAKVKTYTSATVIVIADDLEDTGAGAYTGGVISAGATFTVQAATAVQVTATNIYTRMITLKTFLDKAQIPMEDRFIVMPADIANLLLNNGTLTLSVDAAYQDVVTNGFKGMVAGFKVFQNEQVAGDSVNGYHVIAGHKAGITFALGFTETGIEDLIGDFGKAYKGLNVYGAKVVDERRKTLAEGFWKL